MASGERRAERRLITCLFIDIVGSTEHTVALGPERMKRALDAAFADLRAIIEREGGTLEKYVGDEVYALFGAPTAHADDPLRALRAADAARGWARGDGESRRFGVRAGVETGEALVDVRGTEVERQQMSVGACVNIAARLQQAAEPGQVLVGPTCHEATGDAAQFEALGSLTLKGIGPLSTWSLVRVGASRALPAVPFVGREAELDVLDFALRRARSGRAVLALVSGAPGQGKTRLVEEFLRRVGGDVQVLLARSRPGGENGAETPLRQLLEAEVGAADPARVRARVTELLGDGPEAARIAQSLAHSAGLAASEDLAKLPSEERTDEITSAWRRYLRALTRRRPVALWMEDVHWAESSLVQLLDSLTLASDAPLLVVATARPEFSESAGLRPGGDRFFVELPGLPVDIARTLAAGAGAADALVERAEGNPLFIIELARSRASSGSLPLSLQGAIGGRLDELAKDDRDLLQLAAVAGERFTASDVAALAGRAGRNIASALDRLASLQYLARANGQYRFHHALVRDVAYGRLPIADRMRLHARYARTVVAEGDVEMRAHHFWEALRPPEADWVWEGYADLAELRREAGRALLAASQRYRERFATDRALETAERARALADGDLAVARAEHALAQSHAELSSGDRAWEHYCLAIAAYERSGEPVPAGLYADMLFLAIAVWGFFRIPPPPAEVDALLADGEAAARREKDDVALARILVGRARHRGETALLRQITAIVEASADARPFAPTLLGLALQLAIAGDVADAGATYARVDALRRAGAVVDDASLLLHWATFELQRGDLAHAAELADQGFAASATRGPHLQTHAWGPRSNIALARGATGRACRRRAERSSASSRRTRPRRSAPSASTCSPWPRSRTPSRAGPRTSRPSTS